ncbi:MAG TPA: response regulator [Armatimonadota bacterium]|nr:response regulator [Armatimonadota bacterium]HQK92330.1 response regulator [Armatimonadota bacterium]
MSTGRVRVLVADDEEPLVSLLCTMLNDLGYETSPVYGGLEALSALANGRYDVVITDLVMPDVDGLTVLRRCKECPGPVEAIVLTGQDDVETAVACMKAGAYDFLTKPFRLDNVASVVGKAAAKVQADEENRHLRDTLYASQRTLMNALDAKDTYTCSHCVNVARLALSFCDHLGLSPEVRDAIRKAGELHDVGKIGIADHILNKPGRLTGPEYEEMKRHPVIGKRIVDPLGVFGVEGDLLYYHHERWDGRGYPDGLSGDTIPLVARVLAVVDVFDALTSDRPYRAALALDEALRLIEAGIGSQFDPAVGRAFLEFLEAEPELIAPPAALADEPGSYADEPMAVSAGPAAGSSLQD